MQTITQREFDDDPAAVMAAVANGETYIVTSNGVEVAELRPRRSRRKTTSAELQEIVRKLPRVDFAEMRRDIDEAFGSDFLDQDNDPWLRPRG